VQWICGFMLLLGRWCWELGTYMGAWGQLGRGSPARPGGRPAARSHRKKAEILARFKESNARSAPFFFGARWHGTFKPANRIAQGASPQLPGVWGARWTPGPSRSQVPSDVIKRAHPTSNSSTSTSTSTPKFSAHPESPAPGWWQCTRRVRSKSAVKLL
jgi:hypothetical protein